MEDRDRFIALTRRIEAHRWILLALLSALSERQSIDRNSLIDDLQALASEMRKRNEATEIIDEIQEVCRLADSLAPQEPDPEA